MPKKILEGVVVDNKANKTVAVLIERKVIHKKYKKTVKITKKYLVHDEQNTSNIGDKIKVIESAPISKRKKWQIWTKDRSVK